MEKRITIKGVEYPVKHCVRARIICEGITGKMWNLSTLSAQYSYMYATILAADRSCKLDFETFLDEIDENPAIFAEWQGWVESELKAEALKFPKKPEAEEKEGEKN